MKVVDANVLLYSVNTDAEPHEPSRRWLDTALAGSDRVGLAWLALLAFVRLSTKETVFSHPLTTTEATTQVQAWLDAPGAVAVQPTARHADVLARLLERAGTGGNLTSAAHLAALALEHRGSIVSYDSDFDRFPDVRWARPDELI